MVVKEYTTEIILVTQIFLKHVKITEQLCTTFFTTIIYAARYFLIEKKSQVNCLHAIQNVIQQRYTLSIILRFMT